MLKRILSLSLALFGGALPLAAQCGNLPGWACGQPIKGLDLSHTDLSHLTDSTYPYCAKHPKSPGCGAYDQFNNHPQRPAHVLRAAQQPEVEVPASWHFAHPTPDAVFGINVASLRQSPALHALLAQLAATFKIDPAELDRQLSQVNDVDQCWVSIRSKDVLVLIQGHVNLPAGFVQQPNGMTSYQLSKDAFLLGKQESVRTSLERMLNAHSSVTPTMTKMKALAKGNDLWFSGTSALMPQAPDGISGYSGTFSFQQDLNLGLNLRFTTEQKAREMLAKMQERQSVPDGVNVSSEVEGTVLNVKVAVSQAKMSDALQKLLAQPWAQQLTASAEKSLGNTASNALAKKNDPKRVGDFKTQGLKVTF
ncbi:MAG: hypothetical protein JOZ43_07810 [Acidobacteriales bacterium]|nr:hypothetical protein [Terriglobales bacterium]